MGCQCLMVTADDEPASFPPPDGSAPEFGWGVKLIQLHAAAPDGVPPG